MSGSRTATIALLALVGGGVAIPPAHAGAPSTTTLVLSTATSVYGQTVTASAQVVTAGTADGDVHFTVDGTTIKANLNGGGSASITLPRETAVGAHAVSASFVPRLPSQDPSASEPASWVVSRARTLLRVRLTGRGAHVPTSVVALTVGDFGTRATGSVSVRARHVGSGKVTRRTRTLDPTGAVTLRLGILRTGRYRLRVTYAGDAQHLAERHSERFTVRQR